jgi:hypothetical protein
MTTQERVHAVADYGFTERQARFLVLVMPCWLLRSSTRFQSISACRRGRRIAVVSPAAVNNQRRIQGLRRASGADPS